MIRQATTLLTAAAAALLLAMPAIASSPDPQVTDLTAVFRDGGVAINGLQVYEVGGIVVIRGETPDRAQAAAASTFAQSRGYSRVANLVQISEPANDAVIERAAERELAVHRGLDGCKLRVSSHNGVVRVAGQVQNDLQKDMAVQLLRNVDGVRAVQSDLNRF